MGLCLFSLDFWGMELLFCLRFCQTLMRISFSLDVYEKSDIKTSISWLENSLSFARIALLLLAASLQAEPNLPAPPAKWNNNQPDELRAWCFCINVSAPQGAAHPPCHATTKYISDSNLKCFLSHSASAVTQSDHRAIAVWGHRQLLLHYMSHCLLSTCSTAPKFALPDGCREEHRETDWADPRDNYVSKTLKEIFSNTSATNDQNVITVRRQMLFL